jgi:uncharacterized membrane protein
MERIEKTIEVQCPVRTAYNQWTQFEEFPRFMSGVIEVRQLDNTHVHWHADVWGEEKEWDAEITEQVPDQRISWQSTSGAVTAGTVRFEPLGPDLTRVRLVMAYQPEGAIENMGDALGALDARVQETVEDFKEFIESRGAETGGWRGEVHDRRAQPSSGGETGARSGAAGGERVPGGGTGSRGDTIETNISNVGRTGPAGGERAPGGGVRLGTSIGDTGASTDDGPAARERPIRSDQRK